MKIFILGTGHMGAWLIEELCLDNEVAIFDKDQKKMKYFYSVERFTELKEVEAFNPDMVINATSLNHTLSSFNEVLPLISDQCIIADIASVKTDFAEFYKKAGKRFVSTHPMFGPTFANLRDLSDQSAVIIKESDDEGKAFFHKLYKGLNLNVYEYDFDEHDQTIAYSLSIPFSSSMVFASCMKKQNAPGTTFKKHYDIANKLLAEDDYLLSEILFNPYTLKQIENINSQLSYLTHIIRGRDFEEMQKFFMKLRNNLDWKKD
jgi:prephenate dehydrogenase